MIVIGVDTHKRSHTLAAVDATTGVLAGELTFAASDEGHADALRFTSGLDAERVWAIEDCRHVSGRLERQLVAAGERVIRVPPAVMGASRRGQREPGKSDQIDALAVARAVIRDGTDRFPVAVLDERSLDIRLLHDHRDQLVVERVRLQNALRWHLVTLDPALEQSVPLRGFDQPIWQQKVARRLARLEQTARVRIARAQLKRIVELTRQIIGLYAELETLVLAHTPQLLQERGCGPITAAILIGHTAGAERFANDARFARQSGTAPIPASSGKTNRHRLHRGGDRQLNRALHTIALVRARTDPTTRAYLDRKKAEGKTTREAIRCLKRHLARHIWKLLYATSPGPRSDQSLAGKVRTTELLLT